MKGRGATVRVRQRCCRVAGFVVLEMSTCREVKRMKHGSISSSCSAPEASVSNESCKRVLSVRALMKKTKGKMVEIIK